MSLRSCTYKVHSSTLQECQPAPFTLPTQESFIPPLQRAGVVPNAEAHLFGAGCACSAADIGNSIWTIILAAVQLMAAGRAVLVLLPAQPAVPVLCCSCCARGLLVREASLALLCSQAAVMCALRGQVIQECCAAGAGVCLPQAGSRSRGFVLYSIPSHPPRPLHTRSASSGERQMHRQRSGDPYITHVTNRNVVQTRFQCLSL